MFTKYKKRDQAFWTNIHFVRKKSRTIIFFKMFLYGPVQQRYSNKSSKESSRGVL